MTVSAADKVVPRSKIRDAVAARRAAGERIVFTNGCFDILHIGHARYLAQARALGDILVVGVNSDASVRALKGPARPVVTQEDRAELLAHLECVDMVCIFDETLPTELIDEVAPDYHVKGGDYQAEALPEAETVWRHGGQIVIIPLVPGRSTTALLKSMSQPE